MGRTISRAKLLLRNNGGQTMAEYAVVLAVVTAAAALLFAVLGNRVVSVVNHVAGLLP
jgi:Flp pilus assembly pilin Flp